MRRSRNGQVKPGAPGRFLPQRGVPIGERDHISCQCDVPMEPEDQPATYRNVHLPVFRRIVQEPGDAEEPHPSQGAGYGDLPIQPPSGKVVAQLPAQVYGRSGVLGEREPASVELPLIGVAGRQRGVGGVEEAQLCAMRQTDADDEGGKPVTFRSGASLRIKRWRKLNCTVPEGATQSPETLGDRSSSDWAASGTGASQEQMMRRLRNRVTRGLRPWIAPLADSGVTLAVQDSFASVRIFSSRNHGSPSPDTHLAGCRHCR